MSGRARAAVIAAAVAAGVSAFVAMRTGFARESVATAVVEMLTGWSFVAAGLVAAARRPGSRVGVLMIAVGFAWFAPDLRYFETSLTFTMGELFEGFQWLVLTHLLATFPTGRTETRWERWTLVAIYLFAIPNALGTLPVDPRRDCDGCLANLLSIHPDVAAGHAVRSGIAAASAVIVSMAVVSFVGRWRRATPSGRRAFTPVLAGTLVVALTPLPGIVARRALDQEVPPWVIQLAFLSLSSGLLAGLLRTWLDRAAVGRLVVELGAASTPARLRDALAQALHDPTVELLYWERGQYVDGEGVPRALPAAGRQRAVTRLGSDSEPVGALIHDPLLLDDPALVQAVGEAARLALENERLQAAVRAQLEEIRASRQRIAETALTERRRVERDLHDGAQQRLVMLSMAITMAQERAADSADPELQAMLAEVSQELSDALSELRELARGIHPALLTEAGLGPALRSLAERSPLPARLVASPPGRYPASVEATAYFVVSESLTNIAKHARATSATISARQEDGEIVVEVSDDGVGGADAVNGTGLAGLADRVAALGGRVAVHSPPGRGTRLEARIPCG